MFDLGSQNPLDKAMIYLIREQRFYAEFLMRVKKEINYDIPTIGVGIAETGFRLIYNPNFFNQFSIVQQADILKHECHHILNAHFEREKYLEPDFKRTEQETGGTLLDKIKKMQTASRLNIAEDIAINEYLPNLPRKWTFLDKDNKPVLDEQGNVVEAEGCFVEGIQKKFPGRKIEKRQIFEYYYHIIKEEEKKNPQNSMTGMCIIDSHDDFEKIGKEIDGEFVKELSRKLANDAAKATREAGNIPGEVQGLIDALNHKPKDWKADIRKFVSRACESIMDVSKRKRNRRYGMLYAGHVHYPYLHLAVAADSSGSVSDEEYTQFMAELEGIHKEGVRITFIECDAKIQYVGEFKPKKKLEVKGRGGTLAKPVFDLLGKKEFKKQYGEIDGLIYLTDLGIFDVNEIKKPQYPVLWAGIGEAKNPFSWGRETRIKIQKRK